MMSDERSVWEEPDRVEEFAARDADVRLMELTAQYDDPGAVRVLDLGCAGGRNAAALAERGFDVYALDSSSAMVAKTRERLAAKLGDEQAVRRVREGRMEDLSEFDDGFFDMVVALGIYHNARNRADWDRTLAESARVLREGGRVLVANFSPRCDPDGQGMRPVAGEPDVYIGFGSERLLLLEAEELDAEMARHRLLPETPSQTVTRETDKGRRVVVNALYRKRRQQKES
jgi:SAM-dependent methyltransferase